MAQVNKQWNVCRFAVIARFITVYILYNFHIFRLFGFGKEEVDVYRFMSKQVIALFAGLLVLCSIQFISPPKMRDLILRRKTGTISVEVFTFTNEICYCSI